MANFLKTLGEVTGAINPLLGAATSLIGGAMSSSAQKDANASNLTAARETNAANKEINDSQLAASRKQFEDQLAENRFLAQQTRDWQLSDRAHDEQYNSASAIAQRLRDAGINPYLAMTEGAAGAMAGSLQAGSPPQGSPSSTSIPSAIPMEKGVPAIPVDGFGKGISAAYGSFLQGVSSNLAVEKQSFDIGMERNRFALSQLEVLATIDKLEAEKALTHEQANLYRSQVDFNNRTMDDRVKAVGLQNDEIVSRTALNKANEDLAKMNAALAESNIKVNEFQITRGKALLQYEIEQFAAAAASSRALAGYYNQLTAQGSWDLYVQQLEGRLTGVDPKLAQMRADIKLKLANSLSIDSQNKRQQADFDNFWKRFIEPILGNVVQAVGIFAGLRAGRFPTNGVTTIESTSDIPMYNMQTGDVTHKHVKTTTSYRNKKPPRR